MILRDFKGMFYEHVEYIYIYILYLYVYIYRYTVYIIYIEIYFNMFFHVVLES